MPEFPHAKPIKMRLPDEGDDDLAKLLAAVTAIDQGLGQIRNLILEIWSREGAARDGR